MLLQRHGAIPRSLCCCAAGILPMLLLPPAARGALEASQVAILVNKDAGISSRVARMYQQLRAVPDGNVLRLSLGSERQLPLARYWTAAAAPVKAYLEAHPDVRCILTTAGDPYTIGPFPSNPEGIAFDNELAGVLRQQPEENQTGLPNPLYLNGPNPYGIADPRLMKMVFVVRLDGPDLKTITRMVQDAVATEQTGFMGPVFGDAQGIDAITGSGLGDASIRQAVDRLAGAGFDATLDLKPETWVQPKGGVGGQAADAAFYVGWYSFRNFQDIFGPRGLARGSIAWHIASGEAVNIWDPDERGWCVNLLRHGAAVTLGPVREPYLEAFPHGDVFIEGLLSGASIAESYWLSLPNISWAMVILGDPLYRPFALHPRPALVARAYVAENSSHVLGPGETSPLLVQLECVGPAGSSTPAMTAVPEPEGALATASGTVAIPPLKAGQFAVVRVPHVTAGSDPAGLFRLALKVQTQGEQSRRIVLEGRVGLARLTWGVGPKTLMFPDSSGILLIAGQPGFSALISTQTLRTQLIATPKGTVLAAASFAPDGEHIALEMLDPQQKKEIFAIANSQLQSPQLLPAGSRFVRWLGKDRFLLAQPNGLISRSLQGGADGVFDVPEGWSSTVIGRSAMQVLSKADGTLAVRDGAGPIREILSGTGVKNFVAIADDLSVFGGVDAGKRLWVQKGFDAVPKIVDEDVERVLWGPISRVALVSKAGGKSRVYDSRNDSWFDLGMVSEAQWSSNEDRLLFVQPAPAGAPGTLSLLTSRDIQPLLNLSRTGPLGRIAFAGEDHALLQAQPTGEIGIWMLALPQRNAGK